jgi:hypothetical protein
MNYRPWENTLEALQNPKFLNHSVGNMDFIEPSKDQKCALGKRFFSNSRVYMYGRALQDMSKGSAAGIDNVSFLISADAPNAVTIRDMRTDEYGLVCLSLSGGGGGGGGGGLVLTEAQAKAAYTTEPAFMVGQEASVYRGNLGYGNGLGVPYTADVSVVYAAVRAPILTPIPVYSPVIMERNVYSLGDDPFLDAYVREVSVVAVSIISTQKPYDAITLATVPSALLMPYYFGWFFVKDFEGTLSQQQAVAWDIPANEPEPMPDQGGRRKLPPPNRRKHGKR